MDHLTKNLTAPITATKHRPEDPLPTVDDVIADWGLGFQLGQALRNLVPGVHGSPRTAWGLLFALRNTLGPAVTAGAEPMPATVATPRQHRISADDVNEALVIERPLRSVTGHIERASKCRSAMAAAEALGDALAALDSAISAEAKRAEEIEKKMVSLYVRDGVSTKAIAERFGVGTGKVRRVLVDAGVELLIGRREFACVGGGLVGGGRVSARLSK